MRANIKPKRVRLIQELDRENRLSAVKIKAEYNVPEVEPPSDFGVTITLRRKNENEWSEPEITIERWVTFKYSFLDKIYNEIKRLVNELKDLALVYLEMEKILKEDEK